MKITLKGYAPDLNYVDSRPLYAVIKKLPKVPAYMKCDSLVFPARTKYKRKEWTISDSLRRLIPGANQNTTAAYVAAYERLNGLVHTEGSLAKQKEAA